MDNMQSSEIGLLAEALAKAQGKMTGALKDANNPFFKSRYADLASVWDAVRKPLSDNGLAVIQTTADSGFSPVVKIITILAHSSGQWIRGELLVNPGKNDAQAMGSAITYGRRYALQAIAGVAPEDDDGNLASAKTEAPPMTPMAPTACAPKATEKTKKTPYEIVNNFGETFYLEKGSEYLDKLQSIFGACDTDSMKLGFWESNSEHFQAWQTKAIQAAGKDPARQPTADAFCSVGKDIFEAVHKAQQRLENLGA